MHLAKGLEFRAVAVVACEGPEWQSRLRCHSLRTIELSGRANEKTELVCHETGLCVRSPAVAGLQSVTRTVPIVFVNVVDPATSVVGLEFPNPSAPEMSEAREDPRPITGRDVDQSLARLRGRVRHERPALGLRLQATLPVLAIEESEIAGTCACEKRPSGGRSAEG
jgi:hypothetical protein